MFGSGLCLSAWAFLLLWYVASLGAKCTAGANRFFAAEKFREGFCSCCNAILNFWAASLCALVIELNKYFRFSGDAVRLLRCCRTGKLIPGCGFVWAQLLGPFSGNRIGFGSQYGHVSGEMTMLNQRMTILNREKTMPYLH